MINKHNIDPVVILTIDQLRLQLEKVNQNVPRRKPNETDAQYRNRLMQVRHNGILLSTVHTYVVGVSLLSLHVLGE